MKRDPGLAHLWLGAFLTGAESRCIQAARAGWWKVDLSSAAWTRTYVSFIQETVRKPPPDATNISRADECRLLYLIHERSHSDHSDPPLFPFAPFGFTAMEDTDLDVRLHAHCLALHRLGYGGFSWDCEAGRSVKQGGDNGSLEASTRPKTLQGLPPAWMDSIAVDYSDLDLEENDETSEMVTRNIFTWLRGEDGFPVAERAIRQHEWFDNLDSDDDSPIEGDARSIVEDNLGRWLLGVATKRCNSL